MNLNVPNESRIYCNLQDYHIFELIFFTKTNKILSVNINTIIHSYERELIFKIVYELEVIFFIDIFLINILYCFITNNQITINLSAVKEFELT